MNARASYFKIGLFVLGGISLLVAFVALLAGGRLFSRAQTFETYLDESVQGLDVGSPVKLRGVPLGRVSGIGLVSDYYDLPADAQAENGQKIVVRIEVRTGGGDADTQTRTLAQLIDGGLTLRLSGSAITGIAYIDAELIPEQAHKPLDLAWEPEYRVIPSVPSAFEEFSTAAERILDRLSEMNVERVLANLDVLLVTLREQVAALDVKGSQSQIQLLLSEVRETNAQVQRVIASDNLMAFGAGARSAVERLNATLDTVQGIVEGGRYDLGVTLENLRVASENVRDLTETARSYPSLMILGEPPAPSAVSAE